MKIAVSPHPQKMVFHNFLKKIVFFKKKLLIEEIIRTIFLIEKVLFFVIRCPIPWKMIMARKGTSC